MRKIDFGDAFVFALRFGVTGTPTLLRLGWLPLVVLAVALGLLGAGMAGALFGMDPFGAGGFGASGSLGDLALSGFAVFLLLIGGLLFLPVYVGLIRRAAGLQRERGGLFGYRFGGRELRVLLAGIVYALCFVPIMLLFAAPFVGVAGLSGGTEPNGILVVLGIVLGIAAFCAFVFVGVRLSLLVPLAAAENRVAFGEAWEATKGRFWILLGLYVVVSLVTSIAAQVAQVFGVAISTGLAAAVGGSDGVVTAGVSAAVLVVFTLLGSVYQNLASTGLSGRVLGQVRRYQDESVEEVFA